MKETGVQAPRNNISVPASPSSVVKHTHSHGFYGQHEILKLLQFGGFALTEANELLPDTKICEN